MRGEEGCRGKDLCGEKKSTEFKFVKFRVKNDCEKRVVQEVNGCLFCDAIWQATLLLNSYSTVYR